MLCRGWELRKELVGFERFGVREALGERLGRVVLAFIAMEERGEVALLYSSSRL